MRKRTSIIQDKRRRTRCAQLAALALCAALAGGGCQTAPEGGFQTAPGGSGAGGSAGGQPQAAGAETAQKDHGRPAYVYYIKDTNLMRADVNRNMEQGKNPTVLAEGAGKWANLKNYYNVMPAEDGSFSVFSFGSGADMFDFDEKLISVREEDGRTEIIMEGDAVTDMCGSTLFIQEPDTEDIFSENLKINLYSYRPGEGKKLAVPDIYGFYPAQKGENFCFTRLSENTDGQDLYRYQDGRAYLLAEGMDFAGLTGDGGTVYVERAVDEGENYWHELARIGPDGSMRKILTKEDRAANYYLAPEYGSLYYLVPGDTGEKEEYSGNYLYYYDSAGRKTLLTDKFTAAYEFLEEPLFGDRVPVLFYTGRGDSGAEGLFAAVGENVTQIRLPGIRAGWLYEYSWNITEGNGALYMTVAKVDDRFQPAESRIYRFGLTDNKLSSLPEWGAEGYAIDIQKVTKDGIFYTEHRDTWTLYCDGRRILDDYCPGTLFVSGDKEEEYFAFCGSSQEAPDLVRLTKAGSSKVFMENVVQCEPYAGGIVLLSDCGGGSYPYLGTLSFCGEDGFKVIDTGVTGFFQHDGE